MKIYANERDEFRDLLHSMFFPRDAMSFREHETRALEKYDALVSRASVAEIKLHRAEMEAAEVDALRARAEQAEAEVTRLREAGRCDLCEAEAGYHLCQAHMDDMRFPDTFSTKDGEYPDGKQMILWDEGGETYIGGYNAETGGFFTTGSLDEEHLTDVVWCYLPDLRKLYARENKAVSDDRD